MGLSDDPYGAYCFDEACFIFGRFVEGSMDEAEANTKNDKMKGAARVRALTTILDGGSDQRSGTTAPAPGAFRDPAALMKK